MTFLSNPGWIDSVSHLWDLLFYRSHLVFRVILVIGGTVLLHLSIRLLTRGISHFLKPSRKSLKEWQRNFPKLTTLLGITSSALTFSVYFIAIGFLLSEMGVPVTAYFASASLIGVAVAFGSQGLVQDIVVGLTLIFTDVIDIGDVVDLAGQTGRVHQVGLRFTVLKNGQEQKVFVNNRTIGQINRYSDNHVKLYVDVEIPDAVEVERFRNRLAALGQGMRHQFPSIILSEPDISDERAVGSDEWSYVRLTLPIWPGQADLINGTLKARVLNLIREYHPEYPDWKVTLTTRSN